MKLQEFFDTQKHTHFTDIDKLDLYQNILYKKTKRTSTKRFSFAHAKYFVYSMIFVFLLFGVYGIYFLNTGTLQDYNRFSIIKNGANTAQADYIGQVIEAKGNFFIEHDGVLSKTNNISNGDTILLKENTQLVFEINSGTQSKIIGPAKLVVQNTHNENYKLNLVYGDFLQMEGNERKKQTIELAINDITVKQEDATKPINFKFVKEGNKQIFQNNGANIVVTKSNGTEKKTTITKAQVVAIQNNDIKIFANIDSFTKAIQDKNVSQTFTINNVDTTISQEIKDQETVSLLSLLTATAPVSEIPEEVTKNITSVLGEEKTILDPNQDQQINNNLYADFYAPELKELRSVFIAGDETAYASVYAKVERRIQNTYQILGISYVKNSGDPTAKIEALISDIKRLEETITNKYNVPPKYNENLQSIANSLNDILKQGRSSAAPKEEAITTQEKVQE